VDQLQQQLHVSTWQLIGEQAAAVGKDRQRQRLAAAEAAAASSADKQQQLTSGVDAETAAAAADTRRQLDQAEAALPRMQPQPTTRQALLEKAAALCVPTDAEREWARQGELRKVGC
jgi:hypothetical protein